MVQQVKKPLKERIDDKYGKMADYYAALLQRCHESVRQNELLGKLDPVSQKTSAASLFIRVCARMDEKEREKITPEKLMDISANYSENINKISKIA